MQTLTAVQEIIINISNYCEEKCHYVNSVTSEHF